MGLHRDVGLGAEREARGEQAHPRDGGDDGHDRPPARSQVPAQGAQPPTGTRERERAGTRRRARRSLPDRC
ncbi:MAG TPA: hypothetical protein PKB06_07140, partial [Actinotalea sp.]|nr:hypothetical protein [Actinotalea sp.]